MDSQLESKITQIINEIEDPDIESTDNVKSELRGLIEDGIARPSKMVLSKHSYNLYCSMEFKVQDEDELGNGYSNTMRILMLIQISKNYPDKMPMFYFYNDSRSNYSIDSNYPFFQKRDPYYYFVSKSFNQKGVLLKDQLLFIKNQFCQLNPLKYRSSSRRSSLSLEPGCVASEIVTQPTSQIDLSTTMLNRGDCSFISSNESRLSSYQQNDSGLSFSNCSSEDKCGENDSKDMSRPVSEMLEEVPESIAALSELLPSLKPIEFTVIKDPSEFQIVSSPIQNDRFAIHKGVYKGLNITIEEYKYNSSENTEEMLQNITTYGQFNHWNILKIYGYCSVEQQQETHIYVLRENVTCTLHSLLMSEKFTLKYKDILDIMIQLCDALLYLHQKNYIHENISCDTIFICITNDHSSYHVKLSGIVRNTYAKTDCITLQENYRSVAPELLASEEGSRKSDVYSLGCIFLELLTQCVPFSHFLQVNENNSSITYESLKEIATNGFTPLIESTKNPISKDVIEIINSCFKGQNDRPSVEELRKLIKQL